MAWKSQLPALIAALGGLDAVIDEAGLIMQDVAQAHARVRTGEMRDDIEWEPGPGRLIGYAGHTIYNEFGTRYMSAQPMFEPALEAGRRFLGDEIDLVLTTA